MSDGDRSALLAEAYRRGILPPEMKSAYEEAMSRGLVPKIEAQATEPLPTRATAESKAAPDVLERIGTGIKDVFVKGAQIGARFDPGAEAGFVDDKARETATADVDAIAKRREQQIQSERAAAGQTGTDWYRVGGNALATLPAAALGPVLGGAAAGAISTPVTEGDFATQTAESGVLGAVGGKVGQVAGNALSTLLTPAVGAAKAAAAAVPKFVSARLAGYVVPPAAASAEPGVINNTLSSMAGKIKLQQAASVKNQQVTNAIAAKELGLPEDTLLDEATFNKVRQTAGNAYQDVERSMTKLPGGKVEANDEFLNRVVALDKKGADLRRDFPELATSPDIDALQTSLLKQEFTPRAGVEAIKRLRFQSKSNLKSFDNPAKLELGLAQREGANALEDLIEQRLSENGDKSTVDAYRAARQTIAKSHDIEAATDANGNVDARKIARLADRRPMSGGLKTIAETADAFPKATQNPDKFGGLEQRSILDAATIAASGVASLAHPGLAAGAILPLVRPLARTAALSETIQNRLAGLRPQTATGPMLSPETRNALAGFVRGLGTAAGPASGALAGGLVSQ